jgi:hypothetical protein
MCLLVAATDPAKGAFAGSSIGVLLLIGWLASAVGTLLGMSAALPLDRRGEFALAGLILNGLTCLCPFAFCILFRFPRC